MKNFNRFVLTLILAVVIVCECGTIIIYRVQYIEKIPKDYNIIQYNINDYGFITSDDIVSSCHFKNKKMAIKGAWRAYIYSTKQHDANDHDPDHKYEIINIGKYYDNN